MRAPRVSPLPAPMSGGYICYSPMVNRQVEVDLRIAQVSTPQLELCLGLAWISMVKFCCNATIYVAGVSRCLISFLIETNKSQ